MDPRFVQCAITVVSSFLSFSFSRRLFGAKKTTDPAVTATGVTKTRRGIFSRLTKTGKPKAEKAEEQAAVVEEKKVEEPAVEERGPVDETSKVCHSYTSPSPRDRQKARTPPSD